jgi:hypothetical protein
VAVVVVAIQVVVTVVVAIVLVKVMGKPRKNFVSGKSNVRLHAGYTEQRGR